MFFPKLVNSMFSSMVTRAQLQQVEAAVTAASWEAAQVVSSVESFRAQMTRLDTRVTNVERNRQGQGRGNHGGGRSRGDRT